MLRSVSVLLSTLGVVLALIGAASAAFIGPDDTLVVGAKRVPERAAGMAVRTHPEITRFVNIDLLVRAEAEGGVFLASSHRVDTEDLLTGMGYYEVTRMSLGSLGGVVTEGPSATRKVLRPARITGWVDQVRGDPEAELVVELDGTPLDVVAVPQRARDRVTFTIGAHVAGAFLIQVAVAVAGVLMVLAGWGLRRFLRRREAREDGSGPAPPPRLPGAPSRDLAHGDVTAGGRTHSLPKYPGARFTASRRALVGLLVPVAVASGCAVPGSAPYTSQAVTRTGITLEEARLLEEDASHVYAPEFDAYPMWALVATADPSRVRLVTRDRFAARWLTESRVRIRGALPDPVERAIAPTRALELRAEEVAVAVGQWWPTGEISGVRVDRRTRRLRDDLLATGVPPTSVWPLDPPSGTPRVRLVEVAGGHLAVVRHTLMTPAPRRLTTIMLFPTAGRPRTLGASLVEVS